MGNSSSRPPFNYEAALLSDTAGPVQTVEVDDPDQPSNASKPRRAVIAKDGLLTVPYHTEDGGYPTIWDVFLRGVKKFPSNRCFGTRVFELDEKDPSRYRIGADKIVVRGEYVWETYTEVCEAAKEIGAGLVALGARQHANVGLFSSNRTEWMTSALALYAQNMRVVALYASLGENAVEYIINHGDVSMVLVSKKELPNLLKALPKTKGVTHIIQFDRDERYRNVEEVVAPEDVAKAEAMGVKLVGFSEVKRLGREKGQEVFPNPAKPDDIAYIMYTSGTTGNPKGAVLLHRNVAAAVSMVAHIFPLTQKDQYLSYLPLAHIFETIAMMALLAEGAAVGFFQDNIKKLTDDIKAVRPTLLCGVPRVFNRIHQVVFQGVSEKSCLVKWYFNKAYAAQVERLRAGQPADAAYDSKVFAALRERMGLDNCRVIVSGAAPLPPYLNEFLRVVTAGRAHVLEGYGMTEACAATSIATGKDIHLGHTGPIVPCVEVRLEDIPDMNYLHTDPQPRGEICVRGASVMAGYFKDEENTKATIIDGWLHTGDVGRFNPNGTLSVIDRKKNIMKLSQGEYVAVEQVEQTYQKSPIVGQLWVYGNSFKSFILGVIVPTPEPMAAYLFSKGYWPKGDKESTRLASDSFTSDFVTAMENPAHKADIKAWILEQLRAQDKGLTPYCRIKDIIVESQIDKTGLAFTEQNECLTPTFKLRRPQLLNRYAAQLKKLYAQHGEPCGADERWPGLAK